MKALKLLIILVFVIVGLINHRHTQHAHHTASAKTAPAGTVQAAVNQELLHNAERLNETLRKCKQSAQQSKELRKSL